MCVQSILLRSKLLIRRHWLGLLFAIIAGFIYVAPNLVFLQSASYQGLPMIYTDSESLYLVRLNAAQDGCHLNCNPFIKEYGSSFPFFDSSISPFILALPGIIFNVSTLTLKVFYEFFLPFVLFLLVYWLTFRLVANVGLSVFTASFIILGSNLLNSTDLLNFYDLRELFKLGFAHPDFLIFSRPVNPQFSSIILFVYLHILLTAVRRRTWKWICILTVIHGLSFYVYFFTYAFITAVQTVWLGIYLLRKEKEMFIRFSACFFGALLIGVPQFINFYNLFHHPYYSTMMIDLASYTHTPHISLRGMALLLVCIVFAILYSRKNKSIHIEAYFIVALVATCFLVRNEHVVMGIDMQYFHFERYMFDPIFMITLAFLLNEFLIKKHDKYHYLLIVMSILPVANASLIQYRMYQQSLPAAHFSQKYIPTLECLEERVPKGSVVFAENDGLSQFIPVYTSHYIPWTMWTHWLSVPGRREQITSARFSLKDLEASYGVDYYVREKRNIFPSSELNEKKKVCEDANFIVYQAHS